jgi:hypothetical protein
MGALGGTEGVAVALAAYRDNFGDELGCDQRTDAMQVVRRGAGGEIGDLALQVSCLRVDGKNPLLATATQYCADAVVIGDQGARNSDSGAGGQVGTALAPATAWLVFLADRMTIGGESRCP